MGTTLSASFATRREAEMTVERLVQEFGLERTDIFIAASGSENTVGDTEAGSDIATPQPTSADRDDAPLAGQIIVSVDIQDDTRIDEVRSAFTEFAAKAVEES